MAKGADKQMSWVVWIEIHYSISVCSTSNDEPFFIAQRWYATEWAHNAITFERAVLSAQII
jgi:hypothetical protein